MSKGQYSFQQFLTVSFRFKITIMVSNCWFSWSLSHGIKN